MTSPYVYTPPSSGSSQHGIHFVTPYHLKHSPFSPFIPEIFPLPSPRSSPSDVLPSTPYLSPIELPPVGQLPHQDTPGLPFTTPGHRRITSCPVPSASTSYPASRRTSASLAASPICQKIWSSFSPYLLSSSYPTSDNQPTLHPYLNSQIQGRSDFLFDLSLPTFSPMRIKHQHDPPVLLTAEDLAHPSAHPRLTTLHIVCDLIPHWPMKLTYHGTGPPQPITLGDALFVIHFNLHERITSRDWAQLSKERHMEVSHAYWRRCRKSGSLMEQTQREEGVKRVDFLDGKVRFLGLEWVADGRVRLLVG